MTRPTAPYPAATRAKGWRFELDYEQVEQSDTWALAAESPLAQHALLMMWMVAWAQTPCGSFPADEAVIRAKCRLPADFWKANREILLRGWFEADDGRLYHPTIVSRVTEMMTRRRSEADKKAIQRGAKKPNSVPPESPNVPRDNPGTTQGLPEMSQGNPTPTTDHRPPNTEVLEPSGSKPPPTPPESGRAHAAPEVRAVSPYAAVVIALKAAGMSPERISTTNPVFRELVDAGATAAEFSAHVGKAADKADPFAYIVGCVKGERLRAAQLGAAMHRGPMPAAMNKQQALEASNAEVGRRWVEKMKAKAAAERSAANGGSA